MGRTTGQWQCRICSFDRWHIVTLNARTVRCTRTPYYACSGCSVMFLNPEQFNAFGRRRRYEKEYSARALRGHPSCPPPLRFRACPRRLPGGVRQLSRAQLADFPRSGELPKRYSRCAPLAGKSKRSMGILAAD